ncbi:3-phosphoshikimate 1-carboxyvinyltransferase [Gemmata sp. JC673]|uniref:3-phosphoshikimate 1-carboxyvinyltransferase n=1 Tax=Gemmata algarum TaxID=2975278 RepID=A0ABU5EZ91_9BACT|nr:3-phosphoshikimate 1-carboxyvinyltransferase [Gemmata algarum]MDY3558944.1 3-phosphoshikimate 1-carboxyvinyltransferase [Gemmata algarum]
MSHTYPAELEIQPLARSVSATVTVPGSKSITNRALVLAALARGDAPCELRGVLRSEDTEVMLGALAQLGYSVHEDWATNTVRVTNPTPRAIPADRADLFVANSGTSMRFLAAMVSLGAGRYRLDGIPRMRERPIEDLLSALRALGVNATSESGNGCPPVVIEANGLRTGPVHIKVAKSSQFLSALMMAVPFARASSEHPATVVHLDGTVVSEPYIEMTVRMLESWAIRVDRVAPNAYRIEPQRGHRERYDIEPDASAASYFWAAAAVLGGSVTVRGLNRASLQGDVRFVDVLGQMGCRIEESDGGITVHGGPLRGVDVDMNDISDTVMTLGAVALFADGPTTVRNVAHIRHKETDRIAALAIELRKLGAEVEEREDGLTITPRPLKGCAIDTYNDHRMAMSLALVGLKVPGVVIRNPGCVAKTYPGFWEDLEVLATASGHYYGSTQDAH